MPHLKGSRIDASNPDPVAANAARQPLCFPHAPTE
jgi:hypothetical protein